MAFNGSGTFNLVSGNPVVTGTTISSTWANNTLSDVASGLTNCITRDGQSVPLANLPMGNYKITGLAQATASGDALAWGKNASVPTLILSSGTANGVLYLDGSKAVTSGSALTFDGTNFGLGGVTIADTSKNLYTNNLYGIGTGNLLVQYADTNIWKLNAGTEQMRLTSTGLGIGTSSPSYKLDVRGAISFGGSQIGELASTGGNPYIGSIGALPFLFAINSVEKMRLDSAGNLGLGVTPNAWDVNKKVIQVQGAGSAITGAFCSPGGDTNGTTIVNNAYYNAGWKFAYSGTYSSGKYVIDGANHYFYIGGSGTAGNAITFTQAMTLDSNGNLLVGTTSGSYNTIYSNKTYALILQQVTANNSIFNIDGAYSSGTQTFILFSKNGGSGIGSITYNGTLVAYNTTSDQRLKENIVDAPSAIDSIKAIKVRSFDWKSDGSHVDYGYIAQELLEVAPEAVSAPADPEEMMGVDFGKLTPRIIKAIQELKAELDELKSTIGK